LLDMRESRFGWIVLAALFGGACGGPDPTPEGTARDMATARASVSLHDSGNTDASVSSAPVADAAVSPPDAADPRHALHCSQGKRCVVTGSTASCVHPCSVVSCSAPEMCFAYDVNGTPLATDAYGPVGTCLDPCAKVTCASNQACVPTAHGVPLGACVDRCDCGNCGNCGADGTFVGMQAFCGNPNGSPATKACNVPCSGGAGCIPWDSQGGICWPLEGCFSP
jgi:hypothetical protein